MHVGNKIKKALIDAGKTQVWLAEQLGLSRQMVNILCNKESAQTKTLNEIAKILNITTSDLIS